MSVSGIEVDGVVLTDVASSSIDSLIDTPTNYTASPNNGGNYCVLNPLAKTTGQDPTLTDGNLAFGAATNSNFTNSVGTIAVSSGKWYVEYTIGTNVGSSNGLGFINSESLASAGGSYGIGQASDGWLRTTSVVYNNSSNAVSSLTSISSGDVVMLALDIDNGKAWWGLNGTFENSGDPGAGSNAMVTFTPGGKSFVIGISAYHSSVVASGVINFGQRPFVYPPGGTGGPSSDYKSLCTTNLPTPTIADGSDYFQTVLWTGTGAARSITTTEMSPDFVWIKSRSASGAHNLFDTVRGATKLLESQNTDTETTASTSLTSFNSDGFSLGTTSRVNGASKNYVGWTWAAGDVTTTIAAGSLNSSAYNMSNAITSNLTSTIPTGASNPLSNWFNGQSANKFEPSGSGSIDFTSVSALQNFSGTLQFAVSAYNPNSAMQFTINATSDNLRFNSPSFPASSGGFPSQLITIPVTSLETLDFVSYSGSSVQFWGIYLDGKLLLDSTATPDNVPSVASTCRANPLAGFSIATYTSPNSSSDQSFGHGLNNKPAFVLIKNRDSSFNWDIYHSSLGYNSSLIFTDAGTRSGAFSAEPTSSVVNTKTNYTHNGTDDYIAYCISPVAGFSAVGSYTGTGSSGNMVVTDFAPAFVLIKSSSHSGDWTIYDIARGNDKYLSPNKTDAEENYFTKDLTFLSNGFVFEGNDNSVNASGRTYVYYAVAETPFKIARAR